MWNDDWDGSGLVLDDYLFEGGENSQFHIVKLNRSTGADGKVHGRTRSSCSTRRAGTTELLTDDRRQRGVDRELGRDLGQHRVLRELRRARRRAGTSRGLDDGTARRPAAFRFWTGDDTDASVVIDEQGMLYVGSEYERAQPRARRRSARS